MVSRPCDHERCHQGIAEEHARVQVRLGLRTWEDREGAPGNRGSFFPAPAARAMPFMLAALVETRQLAHKVVETAARSRKLAQCEPRETARRRRPQQQSEMRKVTALDENLDQISHGS